MLQFNIIFKQKKSIKCLGVLVMDCHLSWKNHFYELSKKISRGIGIFYETEKFFFNHLLKQVYIRLFILPYVCCYGLGRANTKHDWHLLLTINSLAFSLVRTNYGMFNIKFSGPKIWNSLDKSLKIY